MNEKNLNKNLFEKDVQITHHVEPTANIIIKSDNLNRKSISYLSDIKISNFSKLTFSKNESIIATVIDASKNLIKCEDFNGSYTFVGQSIAKKHSFKNQGNRGSAY
jgi:hypothetical protein